MSSHHDYIIEITAQHDALKPFAPENGQPLRFKIGDAVIYTNEYGVQFRSCINGFYRPTEPSGCMRAVCATTSIRQRRGCRLRNPACALTTRPDAFARPSGALRAALASGKPAGYPRRASLAPKDRRTGCAGSARNPQPQQNPLPDVGGVVRLVLIEP